MGSLYAYIHTPSRGMRQRVLCTRGPNTNSRRLQAIIVYTSGVVRFFSGVRMNIFKNAFSRRKIKIFNETTVRTKTSHTHTHGLSAASVLSHEQRTVRVGYNTQTVVWFAVRAVPCPLAFGVEKKIIRKDREVSDFTTRSRKPTCVVRVWCELIVLPILETVAYTVSTAQCLRWRKRVVVVEFADCGIRTEKKNRHKISNSRARDIDGTKIDRSLPV